MSVWLTIAKREQIVLAFPDGAVGSDDDQGWNDCRSDAWANPETDDVEFLTRVIDDADGVVPIDRSRVFTVGVSNGGSMALRMAVERPTLVTGAAAIVASMAFSGDDSTVTRTRWSGSADVWLYTIDGGGHTAPSIAEHYRRAWTAVVGPQNNDIESAEEIWSFFVEASS